MSHVSYGSWLFLISSDAAHSETYSRRANMDTLRLALVVALCVAAHAAVAPISERKAKNFELEEVLGGTFSPRGLGATWTGNNTLARRNSTTGDIEHCDPNTLQCVVLVKNATLADRLTNTGGWTLSSDMKLLLWSYNVQKGFRHSNQAQYDVLDIAKNKWYALHGGDHLKIAQFSPNGRGVAYVAENRIYYVKNILESVNGVKIPVEDDSNPNVYYGVPDWVYEEEVLYSGSAMWISKDGSFMAYGKFDDTKVQNFSYITYGKEQYTHIETLNYPKPGTSNPVVSLQIANLNDLTVKVLELPFEESILQTVAWASDKVVVVVWMSRIQNETEVRSCTVQADGSWKETVVLKDAESQGWLDMGTLLAINESHWVHLLPRMSDGERFQRPTVFENNTVSKNGDRVKDKSVTTVLYGWKEASNRIYFLAAPEGKPGQRHVYSTTATGETLDVKCLTCNVTFWETEECTYASATFSRDLTNVAVTCSGPGPAVVRLAQVLNNGMLNWGHFWQDNKDIRSKLSERSQPILESVTFTVKNTKAQVQLLLPPTLKRNESTKYPLLINVYAGPGSQQVSDSFSVSWGTYLATTKNIIYGYIDGRGSGYQGSKTLYAVYKNLGTVEIEDQIDLTNELVKKYSFIDENRVGIWGWSYGGYATAMAIAKDVNGVFKCGASVAPVTAWDLYDTIYTERYMDTPQNNPAGYEKASLLNKAELFKNHSFFLVHGNADDNVHYQQAMRLARELELKKVLFSSQSYPDENHSIRSVIEHVYMSLGNFFDECYQTHSAGPALIPSLLSTLLFAFGMRLFT